MKIAILLSPGISNECIQDILFNDRSSIYLMKQRDGLQDLSDMTSCVIVQFPIYDHVILNAERILIPYLPDIGIEDTLKTINLSKIRSVEVRLVPVYENI